MSLMKNKLNKIDKDIKLSIYADDICISYDKKLNVKTMKNIVSDSFKETDLPFEINEKKISAQVNNRRKVTGVRINHHNKTTVPRSKYKLLKSVLHHLKYNKKITMNKQTLLGNLRFALDVTEDDKIEKLIIKYQDEIVRFCGLSHIKNRFKELKI